MLVVMQWDYVLFDLSLINLLKSARDPKGLTSSGVFTEGASTLALVYSYIFGSFISFFMVIFENF